jgi:RNA polymerase sigma-70 factor (sigma-E family)
MSMTGDRPRTAQGPRSAADAIDDLYRQHGVAMFRFALVLVGDKTTAEDVVQEAFLGLYRGWHRLAEQDAAIGYLRTAVLNGARSAHRSRARRHALLLRAAQHDPPAWSAEAAVMERADRRAVLAAVAGLPRRQREILALRYYLDLSEDEIASLLGVSRGTVSSTGARALAVLIRQFGEEP